MSGYFHGWRRKTGSVLLVLALALMSGWIRSHLIYDDMGFAFQNRQHRISIIHGRVDWYSMDLSEETSGFYGWESFEASDIVAYFLKVDEWLEEQANRHFAAWSIPCGSLVLPLTLLSAYLLLRKPRGASGPARPQS